MTVDEAVNAGIQHFQAGRLADANNIMRQVLAAQPNHPDATRVLGSIGQQVQQALNASLDQLRSGRFLEADQGFRRILSVFPNHPEAARLLQSVQQNVNACVEQGLQHFRAQRLNEAEQHFRAVLAYQPNNPDALHLLGLIAHQVGKSDVAADLIGKSIAAYPKAAHFYSNYSAVLKAINRYQDAVTAARKALELDPRFADAYTNLACAVWELGGKDEALEAYRKAIELKPDSAEAYSSYGATLTQLKKLKEAEVYLKKAIELKPDYAEAYNNLGTCYKDQNMLPEALHCFQKSVEYKPTLAEGFNGLGSTLLDMGDVLQATTLCKRAIELKPLLPQAHYNLGLCYEKQGMVSLSGEAYKKATELKPDYAASFNNWGNALKDLAQMREAIDAYAKAVELEPTLVQAHSNLVYSMHYPDFFTAEEQYEAHIKWDRQHAEPLRPLLRPHENDPNPDRRIKVGYVSPNFKDQVINFCFEPAFARHDKSKFQIFCYSDVSRPDAITARLKAVGHEWRDTERLTDQELADLIRKDQIDILIDLTGHIAYNRQMVFARKPAPVQVTYLGYQNTTGQKTMDYLITDEYTNPKGMNEHLYTEKLVRIPGCFWCYMPQPTPDITPAPAVKNGYVTFAYLNNFAKLNRRMMKVWCEILKKVPNSKLYVLTREILGSKPFLESLFNENGVSVDRLIIAGPRPKNEYLKIFELIDIALDPFPFNGHTTTHDCLWMGVPVVHMSGNTYHSRYGGSVLTAAGIPEWITTNLEDYVNLAVKLGSDVDGLSKLRASLRQKVLDSVLVDSEHFTKHYEDALRDMWRTWCTSRNG